MAERLREESGYSLVEVVVAIMLLGLAIIPMVGMFDAGLRAAVLGSNHDKGRALASEELAEIQALPYSDPGGSANSVVEIYPPGSGSTTCTGTIPSSLDDCRVSTTYVRLGSSGIVADPDAKTMMRVEITVTWDSNSYSTTGLVSEAS